MLGEGAFSQVWRGQLISGGSACALKCIGLESLDDDDEALEMLANEVTALRAAAQGLGDEQRRHGLSTRMDCLRCQSSYVDSPSTWTVHSIPVQSSAFQSSPV